MEKESSKDKFLRECGLLTKPGQEPESVQHPKAIPNQAETASARAQQVQDEADKSFRRLNAFLRDELPAKLVQTFEQAAQNQVAGTLRPLNDSVHRAASQIESCAESLAGTSWNGRLIWIAVLIGITTVSFGACLVRCTLIDNTFDEARRYELYGRKVEANIEKYQPKDKEKLYRYVGGRP
jgi:hypothetical protein